MKTIAVNTRFLLKGKLEGIGRFTCESLRLITQQHPEHRFIFLFDRPYSREFIFAPNVEAMLVPPPARHPFLWYAWFEYALPLALHRIKADLFLSPDGYCSLRSSVKTLMVVHDLAFEHYPEQVSGLVRRYYQHFVPRYCRRAQAIATVSEYTKSDICQLYGIDPNKIQAVYNGTNTEYRPLSSAEKQLIKAKYSQHCDYFLFVGAIHPRKNLANILRAFVQFKQQTQSNIKMLIAGRRAWQSQEAFAVYENMPFRDEVIFLGHLEVGELAAVTGAAFALVYASFFEGFGIPIVEAMTCQVPVITSDVSSMPEVAGNAALLVQPHDAHSIANAMLQLYNNEQLRQQLIKNGVVQCQQFGWQQTADKLWQIANNCLTHKQ
jgi:glycosyltransferase involved in cell wall biosynthesis